MSSIRSIAIPPLTADLERVLIDAETIQRRVIEMAAKINQDYAGITEPLVLVGVLKGSFIFLADLCRKLTVPHVVDFIAVSSYGKGSESKFDSDTRGGAALSLREVVGKPIKFIGVGEKLDNLEPFYPDRMASRILGMGDIVTLVEKAQEAFDQKQAEKLQEKMAKNTFDLQDYLEQIENMTKMGGIGKILDMLPGAKGNVSEDDIDKQELLKEKAIIQSMTFQERQNIYIIGPARKKRIAKGSGTSVGEVGHLLKKFEKMRLNMKKLAKNKKYQAAMMKQMGMN